MEPLLRTELPGLPDPKRGKVREVYDLGDCLLIVATDRISAFDSVMPNGVPDKGRVLNQLSAFWFKRLGSSGPHHLISIDDDDVAGAVGRRLPELRGRCALVYKTQPFPVEFVARGYLAGSLYKEYKSKGTILHGIVYPNGLEDGSRLPEPVFTPATKAEEGHDLNISFQHVARLLGMEISNLLRRWTLDLYASAADHALACGLILADTKFEFGMTPDGPMWIDEALTPDSSRYWEAAKWRPGRTQPSYDKQFVRDWLEHTGWDKNPPAPELPSDVVEGTRKRYLEAYRRLTGRDLEPLD